MTRIVAGTAKGRVLDVPSKGTRPTAERVREALFSRLEHWGVLDNAQVLDLYAGSGALGLEALSRGAYRAVLVDSSRGAGIALRNNVRTTGLNAQVANADVRHYLGQRSLDSGVAGAYEAEITLSGDFTLVFIDPPYDIDEEHLTAVLASLAPWIMPDTLIVVERSSRSPQPVLPDFLQHEESRRWGETTCWFIGPPLPENVPGHPENTADDESDGGLVGNATDSTEGIQL